MTDIIRIEEIRAVDLFKSKEKLDEVIAAVRKETAAFVPDLSTKKGRDDIASRAYKVARAKTTIDNAGKELVAGIKAEVAKVDAMRKHARDTLDALKEEVRRPLDEWEAEQARIAQEEADRARREFEEAEAKRLAEIAERERLVAEREAKLAEELARQQREEQARIEAENQRIREEQIAERARREAEERHRAEQARAEAAAQAEREAEERRAADKAHQRSVNAAALAALVAGGIPEEHAKAVIILVATGKVPAVSINY